MKARRSSELAPSRFPDVVLVTVDDAPQRVNDGNVGGCAKGRDRHQIGDWLLTRPIHPGESHQSANRGDSQTDAGPPVVERKQPQSNGAGDSQYREEPATQ